MPPGRKQEPGNNHLLIIAIDAYEHCTPLRNCVKDAKDLKKVLTERYEFEAENVISLFNDEVTKPNLYKIFRQIRTTVKDKDNLIIYFSGHGYYSKEEKAGYFIPYDAEMDAEWDYFRNDALLSFVRAINAFHTFLMVDSCFSGALFSQKNVSSTAYAEKAERKKSRWALAAGAIEEVEDGFHGDNSPFAKAVLSFLKSNNDYKVPVSKLIQDVKIGVAHNSKQRPIGGHLYKVGDEDGEFVFRLKEQKNEETSWQAAQALDTIAAYDDFLEEYPDGKYAKQAEARMAALEEEEAWQEAQERDTLLSYRRYLKYYRNGKYAEEANKRRKALKAGKATKKEPTPDPPKPPNPITTPSLVEMLFVKGGTFQMGSNDYDSEKPIHPVTVQDFWVGKYPITFEQYDQFCVATKKDKPDDEGWGRGNRPVIHVNWHDALEFCQWLSEKEGQPYRLLSEAEWEYAARGSQKSQGFEYAGSNKLDEVGWYNKNSNGQTHPVGEKKPNELGIYDMSGNVWEWCQDVWHDNYEGAPKDGSAWMQGGEGDRRVVRGGSWHYVDYDCRVSFRLRGVAISRVVITGFRLSRY